MLPLDVLAAECYSLARKLTGTDTEVDSNQPSTQRRRSERVSQSFACDRSRNRSSRPAIRGKNFDAFFQPSRLPVFFEASFAEKYWITLEIPQNSGGRNVRARVAWIQRPHSTRDFFQIAVELESPANIWEMDLWTVEGTAAAPPSEPIAVRSRIRRQNEVNESANAEKLSLTKCLSSQGNQRKKP